MRTKRYESLIVLLVVATVAASACTADVAATSQGTVASHLVMGGPPECPSRITCLLGLQEIYRLHFSSFKVLDEVGPVSVASLAANAVQVVRLDSSDPAIPRHGWVILQDDRSFQQAGNIIPVIRVAKATEEVTALLDKISSALSQDDLFMLDTEVGVKGRSPQDVAKSYVQDKGLGVAAPGVGAKETLTVGSASFSENETLAYIYRDVLTSAGYIIATNTDVGSREQYEPALEAGRIDVLPEYVGNYLTFLNPSLIHVALSSAVSMLRDLLAAKGLTVLDPSSATDADTIVVTSATADKFHLTKISDLGKGYSR